MGHTTPFPRARPGQIWYAAVVATESTSPARACDPMAQARLFAIGVGMGDRTPGNLEGGSCEDRSRAIFCNGAILTGQRRDEVRLVQARL